jgi:hypothetical protein
MWKAIEALARLLLLALDRALSWPEPVVLTAKQVLADGLRRKDAAAVATAMEMRHQETKELLRQWQLEQARRAK